MKMLKMLSSHRDRLLSFLLGAAVLLVFVGAARAQSAAENENLNFQKLYARNLKGMVDDLQPIASADHSKREGGKCWSGYSPEKNEKMSTCCWYGAQTCCKSGAASSFLRAVEQQLEVVHKNGTNDKCYAAIADLLCLWCSPESAKFAEGSEFISVSVCSSLCDKLWGACHDQQDAFGIHPKALTPRQLCTALLVEEEDKDTPQGGVNVVIAPASSKSCFGGVALSLVENSGCLPHVTASTSSGGPSGGAIAAMVLVPFLVIGITAGAVVAYFRMRKRREGLVYLGAGGGGGAGEDEFTLSADAFGEEEGGFLDEEGDISEGGTGLMSDEDSKFSVQ